MQRFKLALSLAAALGMMPTAAQAGGFIYGPYGYPAYGYSPYGYASFGAYPIVAGTVYTPVPYGVAYAPPVMTYNVPVQTVTPMSHSEIVPTPAGTTTSQMPAPASPQIPPVPIATTVVSPVYVTPAPVYAAPVFAAPVYYGRVHVAPLRGIVRIRY